MSNISGYPIKCKRCKNINTDKCGYSVELKVKEAFRQVENGKRVMIIGQEPTVNSKSTVINKALMLDDESSKIWQWLNRIFNNNFDRLNIYATNIVKCTFEKPPSKFDEVTYELLYPYFYNCKEHLGKEILEYKPEIIITLGESAYILFKHFITNKSVETFKMNDDFNGKFEELEYKGIKFLYSPFVHLTTYNVSKTYRDRINTFVLEINRIIETNDLNNEHSNLVSTNPQ